MVYFSYMLRYLKAVQMMKQIIEENQLRVMSTALARYACAYEAIAKPDWWDKSKRYVVEVTVKPRLTIHAAAVQSSSKGHISATCLATLAERLTFLP